MTPEQENLLFEINQFELRCERYYYENAASHGTQNVSTRARALITMIRSKQNEI